MIQPIRRYHLRIWLALAVLLPALFLASLWARREPAPSNPGILWERYR